jgi:hypothetical protein
VTGDEDTRWFRADVRGLRPGHFATTSSSYVHVTSNFDVARAFAVERGNCAVYEVELGGYIDVDLDYPPQSGAGCKKCDWATIIRVVEEEVDWLLEDAWKFMSRYHLWGDLSRMYDNDGYATASPEMRAIGCGAEELRQLGRYPLPEVVWQLMRQICAK